MLRRVAQAAIVAAAVLALTGPSASAQTTTCDVIYVPGSETTQMNPGTSSEVIVITGGAHLVCTGNRRIRSTQATMVRASQRVELFGNVEIDDPERTLTANEATFFSATRQLDARVNVTIRDRRTGSTIRGDRVIYYQESPQRPEARIEATGTSAPARAVMFRDPAAAEPAAPVDTAARDSTVVDASQIVIIGERSFRATGNAVMTQDSMRSTGYSIEYAEATGTLAIARDALVTMPRQQLRGDSIDATIGEGDELREVLARHGAALVAEEMTVTAPAVRLFFEDGGVTRMAAMDWTPATGFVAGARARVVTDEFIMESDSIDVLAPGQQITEAAAFGNAYGERVTPDSLRALLPELSAEQLRVVGSDWMRGDTVRAYFAENPDAIEDVDAPARVMERLLAMGTPALSVYRMRDEDSPEALLSINYLSASRIEVEFTNGTVSIVTAAGDAKGVYLQPAGTTGPGAAATAGGGQPPQEQ
jgi:lipopolysaccharide export system protein LptA